ncbi:hypothetical protein [Streptomyces purpurascens]
MLYPDACGTLTARHINQPFALPEGEDNGLWRINACNDSLGPPG